MTHQEICTIMENGANIYLEYLKTNPDKGVKIHIIEGCAITKKFRSGVRLEFLLNNRNPDNKHLIASIKRGYVQHTFVLVKATDDDPQQIQAIFQCLLTENDKVYVDVDCDTFQKYEHIFANNEYQYINISVDFSWLISAVKKFYQESESFNRHKVVLGVDDAIAVPDWFSKEQAKALRLTIQSPMCYIWGAPGTGKTKAILVHSVLHQLEYKRTVLIIAPTNDAVDNAMSAVIDSYKSAYLGDLPFLRLGIATPKFSSRYPKVCIAADDELPKVELRNSKRNILCFGCTSAYFILNYSSFGHIDHIYVDEAAYCSLPHGLIIYAMSKQLTMLGDHKQLGPVFDYNLPIEEINRDVCVFDHSMLYVNNILNSPKEEFFRQYFKMRKRNGYPTIKGSRIQPLLTSYRYGDILADALNSLVYERIGLKGASGKGTLIKWIPSSYEAGNMPRTNINEADKILSFAQMVEKNKTIAIITPYVNQAKLIQKIYYRNKARRNIDFIDTIHKAQGKEFDIVIVSIVDKCPQTGFYTNSNDANALTCMNTAVSRAKKELVIVADTVWCNQNGQLISELIKTATRVEL